MKRFVVVAALLLSVPSAIAQEGPPKSRIEAITKGARDLVPDIPTISMPALPSMPSLPSMPDFSSIGSGMLGEFNVFTQQVGDTLPILEELGYEISTFRVQWGLPPKAKLRLRSKGSIDSNKIEAIAAKATGGAVMTSLISSAATAKRIQNTMKFGTAILDVDFALPPKVRMSFLNAKTNRNEPAERDVEDLDLACGQALTAN